MVFFFYIAHFISYLEASSIWGFTHNKVKWWLFTSQYCSCIYYNYFSLIIIGLLNFTSFFLQRKTDIHIFFVHHLLYLKLKFFHSSLYFFFYFFSLFSLISNLNAVTNGFVSPILKFYFSLALIHGFSPPLSLFHL